jgi:hypothetical protein
MWTKNFDWTPDQDHGGVSMIALQNMLMQPDGDVIRLLPAWPMGWDVDFKLHAPQNTTVQGVVENGKLVRLRVEPAKRLRDIVVRDGDVFSPYRAQ